MRAAGEENIHQARGAGRWFPAQAAELRHMVEGMLDAAESRSGAGRIVAGISPHAGYVYSGPVSGYTFAALRAQGQDETLCPDRVVVLGFSHRESFRGVAWMSGRALRTPLGDLPLCPDLRRSLCSGDQRLCVDDRPHVQEHSAENQVPFLQAALPGVPAVMGLMGDHDPETRRILVERLIDQNRSQRILLIASTDMLHDPDYERVTKTDRKTLEDLSRMDEAAIVSRWDYSHQIFCGIQPVLTAMEFAREQGVKRAQILQYRNSGDDFPESRGEWVVGYGSALFCLPTRSEAQR